LDFFSYVEYDDSFRVWTVVRCVNCWVVCGGWGDRLRCLYEDLLNNSI
jgi:hypothetical protein